MGFLNPYEAKRFELVPGVNLRPLWGNKVMMVMVEIAPRAVVPSHTHPHEQMGLVLQGEFDMVIGRERKHMKQGDAYLVPSGIEHSVQGNDGWALALDIFGPPREEYIRRASGQ